MMIKDMGVKILSSVVVYKSKWLTVRRDKIVKPDGVGATYDVVERRDIVTMVAKEKDFFYFVEQYRYPVGSLSLELPQGFIDLDESPEKAARRELQEELGVTAEIMRGLGVVWVSSGYSTQQAHIFFAERLGQSVQSLDDTESDLVVKKYTYKEIVELVEQGQIKNAATLAALSLYNFK